ncbi:hypothetical protein BC938DRAFT_472424 [Jimgerdemannia flammicorona]|uniref:Uncharacterized protein n=1 Tax=Jimgerdemannia flammicorona TaxID=994334 RepID=A0A433QZX6_9FUNG|nr:hypothetical protein BC938DRAFT_472424 [Jimgerdemannia flammicorona]
MHSAGAITCLSFEEFGCLKIEKFSAGGRVMIDVTNFHRFNPAYPMDTAQPPAKCDLDDMNIGGEYPAIPDDHLWLASPVLFGFSFATKKWGQFDVTSVVPINFVHDAFDKLVMPSDQKNMPLKEVKFPVT